MPRRHHLQIGGNPRHEVHLVQHVALQVDTGGGFKQLQALAASAGKLARSVR
jgi:hypothetical protein